MCKIIFAEYKLSRKLMSDSGSNYVSDKFKTFCKSLSIEQTFFSSYHHQSNGQVEACIKFVKSTLKKCFDSNGDPHIILLQICMSPVVPGFPRPANVLFKQPIRGIMPIIKRPLVGIDSDEGHYEVLIKMQTKDDKTKVLPNYVSIPKGSTVVVQLEDGEPLTHGTIEGKGEQNHHDRSFHICITKTGQLVT